MGTTAPELTFHGQFVPGLTAVARVWRGGTRMPRPAHRGAPRRTAKGT
jgi:hypothetical protein